MDQILRRAAMAPNMNLIPLEKYDPVHQYEKMSDKMKQRKNFDLNVIKSLQTKNTGNLPVHSQNVRVYGEVTGISRVYRWVTGFFLYYLSCSFVYHAKF